MCIDLYVPKGFPFLTSRPEWKDVGFSEPGCWTDKGCDLSQVSKALHSSNHKTIGGFCACGLPRECRTNDAGVVHFPRPAVIHLRVRQEPSLRRDPQVPVH